MEGVYEVTGKMYKFGDIKTFEKSDYQKMDVFLETVNENNGKTYTNVIRFLADGKRVNDVSFYSIGDEVKIGFVLSGRQWNPPDKDEEINFTDLKIMWLERLNAVTPSTPTQTSDSVATEVASEVADDDLPF